MQGVLCSNIFNLFDCGSDTLFDCLFGISFDDGICRFVIRVDGCFTYTGYIVIKMVEIDNRKYPLQSDMRCIGNIARNNVIRPLAMNMRECLVDFASCNHAPVHLLHAGHERGGIGRWMDGFPSKDMRDAALLIGRFETYIGKFVLHRRKHGKLWGGYPYARQRQEETNYF